MQSICEVDADDEREQRETTDSQGEDCDEEEQNEEEQKKEEDTGKPKKWTKSQLYAAYKGKGPTR